MSKENAVVNHPVCAPPVPKKQTPWLINTGLIVGDSVVLVCSDDASHAATLWHGGKSLERVGESAYATAWCAECGKKHSVCDLAEGLERSRIDTVDGAVLIEMGDFLAAMLRQKAAAGQV